jgi:hypothetical protein
MGWVDLWRDLLYCDVLHPSPKIHTVPVPFPEKQLLSSSEGHGRIRLGYSRNCRGIAYMEAESCLRFVEILFDRSSTDGKDGSPIETMVDWSVKTYVNRRMTNWWEDWEDLQAEAKDIKIGFEFSQVISDLHSRHDGAEPTLRDLFVFQPALSIDHKHVYLLTSGQFGGEETWVLALDLKNKTLVDVAHFGTRYQLFSPIYCFSHGRDKIQYPLPSSITGKVSLEEMELLWERLFLEGLTD